MKIQLIDFCPEGFGIPDNSRRILRNIRIGLVSGTVFINLHGMKFIGPTLLEETIGVLVGEMGEEVVRRRVKFPDADEFDQNLIDRVLTNATQYFANKKAKS